MNLRVQFPAVGIHVEDHSLIHRALNDAGYVTGLQPGTGSAAANVLALNTAIAAARTDRGNIYTTGRHVVIPSGDWYVNDTILTRSVMGLILRGTGLDTRLIWNGPDDRPMFKMAHCRSCRFSDLFILCQNTLNIGIQILRDSPGGIVPTMNEFHNVWMQGGSDKLGYGFVLGGDGSIDANNDFNIFYNCEINNYHHSAWLLPGSQSYNNQMINCRALGNGTSSEYGVATGNFNCGTFLWQGGFVGLNTIADFHLGRAYQPYQINGYNSEGSARMLELTGPMCQVEITNSRWSAVNIHADGRVITCAPDLPWYLQLAIRNCSIGDGANPTAPLMFDVNVSRGWENSGFVFENNRIYSTAESLWLNQLPKSGSGNVQITDEVALTTQPIIIGAV